MFLKRWLTLWGILAALAVGVPGLVAVGIFLIVPGLILLAAPTIFLYSLAFGALRGFLPVPTGPARNCAAAVLVILAGWAIPQPWRTTELRTYERANLSDVMPASPIALVGHLRLEVLQGSVPRKGQLTTCEALCAALLDTPGVESVTLAATEQSKDAPVMFRLISRVDRARGAHPSSPEAILDEIPQEEPEGRRDFEAEHAAMKRSKQMVAAAWAVRLATRQSLVAGQAQGKTGMTVRITNRHGGRNGISISRVEVLGRNGEALFRRSIVTGSALAVPLHMNGYGGLENFRMGWGRERLASAPEYPQLRPVTELFRHTSLARPVPSPGATKALLARLRSAIDNPRLGADDPDFGMADLWLPSIDWRRTIPRDQLSVLAGIIADPRIPLPRALYDGAESKVAPELRGALGSRIVNPSTPAQTRTQLARILARMPEGTFATLSADEREFLGNGDLRPDAWPMIVRLADSGEAAVPDLLAILKSDRNLQPPGRRAWVMGSVALAFATLGPKALGALPEIDALVNSRPSPVADSWSDRQRWYLALARMGKPVDDFEWFSDKPDVIARSRENLRRRVERFDPREVWNY